MTTMTIARPITNSSPPLLTTNEVATALRTIVDEMSTQFHERRQLFQALALATLSKEHTFIFGPPGTAKSMAVRWWFARFTDSRYFEVVMSKTRPLEAVAGPVDLPALRDLGVLRNRTMGYLPTCHFAMIDEVGKMSISTGNDMLAMLNERIFHEWDDVTQKPWHSIPLYSAAGGSNEIPGDDADDAAAIWDRFVFRVPVGQVQETSSFVSLVMDDMTNRGTTIDFASLARVIDEVVPDVLLTNEVADAFVALREKLLAEGITPSNRRWRQAAKAVKANAVLNGRTTAEPEDLEALQYVLWESPEQISIVTRHCLASGSPLAAIAMDALATLEDVNLRARDAAKENDSARKAGLGLDLNQECKRIIAELERVKQQALAGGSSTTKITEALGRARDVKLTVGKILGMD